MKVFPLLWVELVILWMTLCNGKTITCTDTGVFSINHNMKPEDHKRSAAHTCQAYANADDRFYNRKP